MSIKVMSLVYGATIGDLKYTHVDGEKKEIHRNIKGSVVKSVLLAYADHANEDGRSTYPSQKLLAKKTELTTVTINNAVKALRQNEFLFDDGVSFRGTKSYIINIAKLTPLTAEVNPIESMQLTGLTRTVLEPSINHHSPKAGENSPSENKKLQSETSNFLAGLRQRESKRTPKEKKQTERAIGIEEAIFADKKVTPENQAVTAGDTLDSRLAGWYKIVAESEVDILRWYCEAFGKLPPMVKAGKKQSSIVYAWRAGVLNLSDLSQYGDLHKAIRLLGAEYKTQEAREKFAASPNSVVKSVYAILDAGRKRSNVTAYAMDEDGMIVSAVV